VPPWRVAGHLYLFWKAEWLWTMKKCSEPYYTSFLGTAENRNENRNQEAGLEAETFQILRRSAPQRPRLISRNWPRIRLQGSRRTSTTCVYSQAARARWFSRGNSHKRNWSAVSLTLRTVFKLQGLFPKFRSVNSLIKLLRRHVVKRCPETNITNYKGPITSLLHAVYRPRRAGFPRVPWKARV
jgi:hypothetical protein